MDAQTLWKLLKGYASDAKPGGLLNPEVPKNMPTEVTKGLLGFTPVVGDAISGYDTIQSARQGNYGEAALNGIGVLPFVPAMGGVVKAYHGSPVAKAIKEIKPSAGGELGPGFYISKEKDYAKRYMQGKGEDGAKAPGILGLDIEPLNIKDITRKEYLDARAKLMSDYQKANGGEWKGEFFDKAQQQVMRDYIEKGYKGIYDTEWRQGVVFPDFVKALNFSVVE